jgi:hypothetical protein
VRSHSFHKFQHEYHGLIDVLLIRSLSWSQATVTRPKRNWNLGCRKTSEEDGCSNTHTPFFAMMRTMAKQILRSCKFQRHLASKGSGTIFYFTNLIQYIYNNLFVYLYTPDIRPARFSEHSLMPTNWIFGMMANLGHRVVENSDGMSSREKLPQKYSKVVQWTLPHCLWLSWCSSTVASVNWEQHGTFLQWNQSYQIYNSLRGHKLLRHKIVQFKAEKPEPWWGSQVKWVSIRCWKSRSSPSFSPWIPIPDV